MAASEKDSPISSPVWRSLATIGTIVVSSIMGFQYLRTEIKSDISTEMKPLVERVEKLEKNVSAYSDSQGMIRATQTCTNNLINFINTRFNKEFMKPEDIIVNANGISTGK